MTKEEKRKKELQETKRFKEKYFDYYDDIKSHTHKRYDWQAREQGTLSVATLLVKNSFALSP